MQSELVTRERDEAQSMVQALMHVIEGLEAHIMDRATMNDPASPETYLSILRGDVAHIKRDAEQICAARWADYKRRSDQIERLHKEVERLRDALQAVRDALTETAMTTHQQGQVWWLLPDKAVIELNKALKEVAALTADNQEQQ